MLRPMKNRKSEKPLAIASIFFGCIACIGLILLTIFDAFNHSTLHWTFALIFFVGLAISGALNVAEITLLHRDHPESRLLKWSYRIKICIIVLAVICLICMLVLMGVSCYFVHSNLKIYGALNGFLLCRCAQNHPTNMTLKAICHQRATRKIAPLQCSNGALHFCFLSISQQTRSTCGHTEALAWLLMSSVRQCRNSRKMCDIYLIRYLARSQT
jgi:amino acid transporter